MRARINGVWTVLGAAVLTACAATTPPGELVSARAAYKEAAQGPARQVAPVELDDARLALEEAEAAFDDNPEARIVLDLAYVAEREAQKASASARRAMAERAQQEAEAERERLRQKREEMTQTALSHTREQLESTRDELESNQARLGHTQSELAERQRALEQERQARMEAERAAAAAIESLKEIAKVKEESRGLVITLSGAVLFASGQSNLLPIAQQKLNQVAETLKDNSGRKIIVEGHTDSRGSDSRNQELSLARANSVRSYLVGRGVEANMISAVGIGETRPVADNSSADGRANNRRVEIVVEPEK